MVAKRIFPLLICLVAIFYFGCNLYYWGQQNAYSSAVKSITKFFPNGVKDNRTVSDEVTLIISIRGEVTKEIDKSFKESSLLTAICIGASLSLMILFLLYVVFENFQKSKIAKSGKAFPVSPF
ncbi:MAG TPA: hypothetical protein VGZ71_14980 [Puia sp.]|jgi:hypothetical protein|nr:hypothetical protein [Puia sp.]